MPSRFRNWWARQIGADCQDKPNVELAMEMNNDVSRIERICDFIVGLTVLIVSYAATLLAAQYFIMRLC